MNKKLTAFVVLVVAVVVTSFSVSGTYAKYTSAFEGTDTARVAKWAVTVGGVNGTSASRTFSFDLFTHSDTNVDADGNGSEKVIAPGTTGNVPAVSILNNSEVTAEYTVEYTITNDQNIPVEFTTDGGTTWVKPTNNKITVTAAAVTIPMNGSATLNLGWRWLFDGANNTNYSQDDASDTDLGSVGTATIKVDANVVVTQVD